MINSIAWGLVTTQVAWTLFCAAIGGGLVALLASVAIIDWNRRKQGLFWAWVASMIIITFIYMIYLVITQYLWV